MSAQATFTCPYCGETKTRDERSVEHPLPRALGGHGFKRKDFCDPCNKRAGREVDRPFVEHEIMQAMRHKFAVRDARGDVPPAPRMYGDSEQGGRGYLELGQEPRVRRVPRTIRDDDTGATIITDIGDGAAAAEQHRLRIEQRGRELHGEGRFRIEMNIEQIEDPGVISIRSSLASTAWPRFGAKLGLAFGREVLGDAWVRSDGADRLRRLLWNDPGAPHAEPLFKPIDGDDAFTRRVPPPQHMVMIANWPIGCGLMVQLFGGLRYGVPLSDDCTVEEMTVWIFDPVAGTARRTPFMQLVAE